MVSSFVEDIPVPEYHWAPESAYEAFGDMKYGIRIHWGNYSVAGFLHESWPFLDLSFQERARYNELYKMWNPSGFDADEWTSLFAENGMRMFAFTTKHHEGFSMLDTKTRVRQRIRWDAPGKAQIEDCDFACSMMETPFRRDVVKELCDAGRKRGLRIALYFSHPDWYDTDFRPYADDPVTVPSAAQLDPGWKGAVKRMGTRLVMTPDPTPEQVARMMARHRTQLTELLTRYGDIHMLSLDQWLGPAVWPQLRETILELRKLQPNVMMRARGIGNYGVLFNIVLNLTVVLVNSELIEKLGFGVLPSVPFRPSRLGALRLCFCLLPEPCGAAVRNPGCPSRKPHLRMQSRPSRKGTPLRDVTNVR